MRDDTIAALATARGRSAVAVVRVSGPEALAVCRRMVRPLAGWPVAARTACRCSIHEADDPARAIDDGLVTVFPGPNSYTGDTLVELGVHGGTYVPDAVLAAVVRAGARLAQPGEFTERAVLNGKLDLLRAEAIGDLIDARSKTAHRMALRQLSGELSHRLAALRAGVIGIGAMLAYDVDFPGEDDGPLPRRRVLEECDRTIAALEALLATVPSAILGLEGATVVLAGPPNAGKSSLLNALVGESRVIVSETPGTTRDAVDVLLDHEPWPLRLVDTAGLRDAADPVERLGVEVSSRWLARAHVVVACAETVESLERVVVDIQRLSSAPVVGALTKRDLAAGREDPRLLAWPMVPVSAKDGSGLTALLEEITKALTGVAGTPDADVPMVTRARHRAAIEHARGELASFREAWSAGDLPAPVAAVHVRAASLALDELIGAVDVDDVLARVFATFCVGK